MIRTKFGSEIVPLKYEGKGFYRVKRVGDNAERIWHMSEFVYDLEGQKVLEDLFPQMKMPVELPETEAESGPRPKGTGLGDEWLRQGKEAGR